MTWKLQLFTVLQWDWLEVESWRVTVRVKVNKLRTLSMKKVARRQLCGRGLDVWKATRSRLSRSVDHVGGWRQAGQKKPNKSPPSPEKVPSQQAQPQHGNISLLTPPHTHSPPIGGRVQLLLAALTLARPSGYFCTIVSLFAAIRKAFKKQQKDNKCCFWLYREKTRSLWAQCRQTGSGNGSKCWLSFASRGRCCCLAHGKAFYTAWMCNVNPSSALKKTLSILESHDTHDTW